MFFLGAVDVAVLRMADEGMARDAAGAAAVLVAGSDVSAAAPRGDFDRAVALPFAALRNGDAVLPIPGVAEREGGLLGRLMVGLSQEEKKSSSWSPAGVLVPLVAGSSEASVTTT